MLTRLEYFSYEDRLDRLGLIYLERRRCRDDLIEGYKLTRDLHRGDNEKYFPTVDYCKIADDQAIGRI